MYYGRLNTTIETTITIDAPTSKVWAVFANPKVTQKMGGEYVSDWQVGSSFGFSMGGGMITNGKILAIEPEHLLQHSLFGSDGTTVISTVTYTIQANGNHTVLIGREDFVNPLDDAGYADAKEGWEAALTAVKDVAEQ